MIQQTNEQTIKETHNQTHTHTNTLMEFKKIVNYLIKQLEVSTCSIAGKDGIDAKYKPTNQTKQSNQPNHEKIARATNASREALRYLYHSYLVCFVATPVSV